jgi:hypothetical protein
MKAWSRKRMLQVLALVLTAVTAVLVLFMPSYTIVTSDSNGEQSISTLSIWEYNGPLFALVLAVPVVVALIPVVMRGRWWPLVSVISAGLLLGFAFLGAMSIGLAFLPAALAAVAAAMLKPRMGASDA